MRLLLLLLLAGLLSACTEPGQGLDTRVEKQAGGRWLVTYRSEAPMNRLAFARSPNDARSQRWTPLSPELELGFEDGTEFARRKDGQAFTEAAFVLTPSYTHLPKDYAPFQPFSDGAMLVHSGRFFACAEQCNDNIRHWQMTVTAPADEQILVNGQRFEESVSWQDGDSGRSFYLGRGQVVENGAVLAVVDPGLPAQISTQLASTFPAMMAYFQQHLGRLEQKPMLFASYGQIDDGRYGRQGGVLPGEVFMHWYGPQTLFEQPGLMDDTLWFLAHEAGHIYQQSAMASTSPREAWIHEGHAELMALLVMEKLFPGAQARLAHRLATANEQCQAGLAGSTLAEAADQGRFQLIYSCGLVMQKRIHDQLGGGDAGLRLWAQYQQHVDAGQPAGQQTFMAVLAELLPSDTLGQLKDMLAPAQSPQRGPANMAP